MLAAYEPVAGLGIGVVAKINREEINAPFVRAGLYAGAVALFIIVLGVTSLYPNDGEDSTTLIKNADIAMYRAKDAGKNTYQFYSADMSARAFERLTLDDFGTGYSSMSYLRRYSIDTLKIDRSFVHDVPGDADDSALASAIIVLAQSLKLDVIAEGVETEAQRDFLRERGCHLMQGYLFSRPVPAAEMPRLLETRNPKG